MATAAADVPAGTSEEQESPYRSPFAKLNLQKVVQEVQNKKFEGYDENEKFVNGNHFQDGAGWVGPPEKASPMYKLAIEKVAAQFTPRDVISEVLDRVVNGVAKQEARIGTAPVGVFADEEEQDKAAEAIAGESARLKAALSTWWDSVSFHQKLRLAIRRSRWSGRGYLRLWVPITELEEIPEEQLALDGLPAGARQVPTGSFEDTLKRIHLEAPDPASCAIIKDEETEQEASVFLFKRDGKDYAELAWVEINEDGTPGDTIVRVLGGNTAPGAQPEEYRWNLGGRLPVMEMQAPLLITDPVRRQQKRLNFFETSLNRNVETAGFPERYITAAEPSGILVLRGSGAAPGPYPTRTIDGKIYEIHPVPRILGAGITTEIQPIKYKDKDGNEQLSNPSVERFEPVDPQGTITASRHAYQTILEEVNQGHILIVGDATASGVSRQQAEGDFISDLSETKQPAEGLIRKALETLIAMGEFFSGAGESFLGKMRITADLFLTPGTATPDQMRAAFEIRDKGGISTEEAMSRAGVEDPTAMMDSLERDEVYMLGRLRDRAKTIDTLVASGWTFEAAAKKVGFTDEEIKEARKGTPPREDVPEQ